MCKRKYNPNCVCMYTQKSISRIALALLHEKIKSVKKFTAKFSMNESHVNLTQIMVNTYLIPSNNITLLCKKMNKEEYEEVFF